MGVIAFRTPVKFYLQLEPLKLNGVRPHFDIVTLFKKKIYQIFLKPKILSSPSFYHHNKKTHFFITSNNYCNLLQHRKSECT